MEFIDPLSEKASLSVTHDVAEKNMQPRDPVPKKSSTPTAPAVSDKEGIVSLDPLHGKANEKTSTRTAPAVSDKAGMNPPHSLPERASTPTAPAISKGKGVVLLDPLLEKPSEYLEGKESVLSPGDAGICNLLAGYFKYYAEEFNHATEVGRAEGGGAGGYVLGFSFFFFF